LSLVSMFQSSRAYAVPGSWDDESLGPVIAERGMRFALGPVRYVLGKRLFSHGAVKIHHRPGAFAGRSIAEISKHTMGFVETTRWRDIEAAQGFLAQVRHRHKPLDWATLGGCGCVRA
jgi:hypothetical protein